MLDFGCDLTKENLEDITRLMVPWSPGFILNSGASFHYWGFSLFAQREWEKFLDYCSPYSAIHRPYDEPLIEKGYIEACKRRGISVLRIFAHPPAKPTEPHVVKTLRPDIQL